MPYMTADGVLAAGRREDLEALELVGEREPVAALGLGGGGPMGEHGVQPDLGLGHQLPLPGLPPLQGRQGRVVGRIPAHDKPGRKVLP